MPSPPCGPFVDAQKLPPVGCKLDLAFFACAAFGPGFAAFGCECVRDRAKAKQHQKDAGQGDKQTN
jgi:hypothetical protein